MPDNDNLNNHTENVNSVNYNPNRPTVSNSSNNQKQENNTPNDHADTKRVVDTTLKGVSEVYAPGVGGKLYDVAKKVPGIGGAIDKTTDEVAKTVDKVPGVQNLTKGLNDSGVTDTANKAIDLASAKDASALATPKEAKSLGTGIKGASSTGKAVSRSDDGQAIPSSSIRKNTQFQNLFSQSDEELAENNEGEEKTSESVDNTGDFSNANTGIMPPSDLPPDNIDEDNTDNNSRDNHKVEGDLVGSFLAIIWNKYKIPIIIGLAGVIFVFLIFLILFISGSVNELNKETTGYYDGLCNYNETRVTLLDCSDEEVLGTFSLQDLVVNLAYAYTKDGDYDSEALKALMITLKTNILSYGNYNNSDKNVEVNICDLYDNGDIDIFDGVEEQIDSLTSLYNEISNYLYISSSYNSTISNLSSRNVLRFNSDFLEEFQDLALNDNDYAEILGAVYNSSGSDDEEIVYRETLFLGDSRTRGMLNAGVINSGNTIYGVGYGYNWLVGSGSFDIDSTNAIDGGISGINNLMRDRASYNIVIWLGINDLANVSNYYQEYYDLAVGDWSDHNIYIVSVGPVNGELASIDNANIEAFNSEIESLINSSGLDNLIYIDLNYTENDISSYDSSGIHYGSSDYRAIYNIIMDNLDSSLSSSYQLYNLTDYCTYYTVTDNDAYWWPIGSREATQGNIYGGNPVSVNITSEFGPRIHPTLGVLKGHGAIDIGSVGTDTPVIATKSGTVNYVYTGCIVGNESCGGAYGNNVKIDHGEGIESLYAHLSQVLVSEGDTVVQGQIIGYTGATGRVTGPHLHFEMRVNGTKVDPLEYVDPENPRPVSGQNISFILAGDSGDYKNSVCSSLLSSGFSENAVAGIMVNMQAESGFSPINLQNTYEVSLGYSDEAYTLAVDNGTYTNFVNDSAGYGIVQWTYYSRKQNLYNFAKTRNASIGDLGMQLEFFLQELRGYTTTYKYVTGNYNAYDVGYNFCTEYERPANTVSTCTTRMNNNITSMLEYVKNGCSN